MSGWPFRTATWRGVSALVLYVHMYILMADRVLHG